MKIGAVIVTYNRMELLKKTLISLCNQSTKLSGILVFDNFSSDNTYNYLVDMQYTNCSEYETLTNKEWNGLTAYYYRNGTNEGGAGGFSKGMKLAVNLGWDYIWIMDDDVNPEEDCLEKLIKAQDAEHMITIPCRTDGNNQDFAYIGIDMSNPFKISWSKTCKSIASQKIEKYEDVVTMPFEGPLINVKLINKIGFPCKDFFIFFDDIDYAMRAIKETKIRYVKHAILHRMNVGMNAFVPWRAYYMYRNNIYLYRLHGKNWTVRNIKPILYFIKIFGGLFIHKRVKYTRLVIDAFTDGYTGRLGKRDFQYK